MDVVQFVGQRLGKGCGVQRTETEKDQVALDGNFSPNPKVKETSRLSLSTIMSLIVASDNYCLQKKT